MSIVRFRVYPRSNPRVSASPRSRSELTPMYIGVGASAVSRHTKISGTHADA